jgi:hypothetical protein
MNYKTVTQAIIPESDKGSGAFKNDGWNHGLSRTASALIFVGSILSLGAFIGGMIKHRFSFFFAACCSGVSALFLMIGAAIWTSIVAKNAVIKVVQVQNKVPLGIKVSAGGSLCELWIYMVRRRFALLTL